MNPLTLAGSVIGILVYVPLCYQILKSGGKVEQKFATWILWAILDGIVAASIIYQHGNFLLAAAFSLGSTITAICIFKSRNFRWGWFDSMATVMAIACMVIWAFSGARIATIASTTAVVIAGLPLMWDCYKRPWKNPFFTYAAFMVSNILTTMGGKNWSVEERLYPAVCTIYCCVVTLLIARKFWVSEPELSPLEERYFGG